MENWRDYIEINATIRSGKPIIKGTRITVADILSYLASGMSVREIVTDFPSLNKQKILAALSFASCREKITRIEVVA
jgi:uncharacterized protein (DUF433 family)